MRPPRWFDQLARRLHLPRERVAAGPRRRRWPEAEDLPRSRRTRRERKSALDLDYGNGRGRARPKTEPNDDDTDDDGGAAVREPRRPVGPGPRSDAGANPIPEPPRHIHLPAEPERH